MNGKRRIGIIFGAIAIALIMISSVTAVEHTNSAPVIEAIEMENQKAFAIEQFETMWYQLLEEESFSTEMQENLPSIPSQDFEDLFDGEGFVNYLVSDEFIDLLSENYNDIISNAGFQYLTNNEYVQDYLQSEEFLDYLNTDEVQYITDNLNIEDSNFESTFNIETSEELQESETLEEDIQPTIDPLLGWIIILIGVITWVPGIIFLVLISPLVFLWWFANYLMYWIGYLHIWFPGEIILFAMISLLITIVIITIACVCWPIVWPEIFGFFVWSTAL